MYTSGKFTEFQALSEFSLIIEQNKHNMSVKCFHISFPNRKLQLYPFRIQILYFLVISSGVLKLHFKQQGLFCGRQRYLFCNGDRLFNVCSCYLHFISCFLSQLLILKSLHSNTLQHFNIVADLISDSVRIPPNKQQFCCVAIYEFLIFYSICWNGSRWKKRLFGSNRHEKQ